MSRSVLSILLWTLALALLAGASMAADKKYIGIGDSITAGTTWPSNCGICPVVFDCTGGCNHNSAANREKCSYIRRLETWLGAGNNVVNEGIGGESTTEALSRFASEMDSNCGTPGDCVSVILMHGTNDMFGSTSPETARDNLAAMIDQAKSRNLDVLLMTIVREVYDNDDPKWSSYRDLTLALAGTKNLQVVDPYAPLCTDNWACYNRNYWVDQANSINQGPTDCTAPGEGDNTLGHLDPDGYDILTDLMKTVFPASTPAAPVPTSPKGDTTDDTPDFVWPDVSTARWYELEVDGAKTWWEDAVRCSSGTCTVNPGIVLADGAHSWRVRGRNLRGMGAWSASTDFVITNFPPPAPVPIGPTGELFESAPLYRWLEAAGATEYDLEVRDSSNNLDVQATGLLSGDVCSAGTCSFVEGTVLTGTDDYTLKVRARNGAGDSPLSEPGVEFTILDCADPAERALEGFEPSPVTTTEVVSHCGPLTAAATGDYVIEASGDLTVHTRDGFRAHDGFAVFGKFSVRSP